MDVLKNYFESISTTRVLSAEEEKRLIKLVKQGDKKAREDLLNANLRFVIRVAKQYRGCGIPIEDIIAEGNIGLMKALEKFDPERGVRFISYAVFWIKQNIMSLISKQGKPMKVPLNVNSEIERIKKEVLKMGKDFQQLSDEDTFQLSEKMGISYKTMVHLLSFHLSSVSMDMAMPGSNGNSAEGGALQNLISAREDIEPDAVFERNELKNMLKMASDELSENERKIIGMRHPLNGMKVKTLSEVGKIMGLSKERIRQIEGKALTKMRQSKTISHLKSFI